MSSYTNVQTEFNAFVNNHVSLLQEAEHAMPASVYYNEYIYAPASNQMSYDGVPAGAVENVQAQNSVA